MGFQLDTSGEVAHVNALDREHLEPWRWSDLTPFTQGYIEAALFSQPFYSSATGEHEPAAFSDFAWETLAQIIEDCAAYIERRPEYAVSIEIGRYFWRARQNEVIAAFPPVSVTLSDDGKVRFAQSPDLSERGV